MIAKAYRTSVGGFALATKSNWSVRAHCCSAFTLTELMVVLAIIGVLIGLLLPAIQRVRDTASRTNCMANLRQLAMAVHAYEAAHRELPQGCAYPFAPAGMEWPGSYQVGLSWHTSILPYVEQVPLWHLAWTAQMEDPRGHSPLHFRVVAKEVAVFLCPSESRQQGDNYGTNGFTYAWGLTSYQGVAGTGVNHDDGMFHPHHHVRFGSVIDGTSNTLLIGERPPGPKGAFGGWYAEWGFTVCSLSQILPVSATASGSPTEPEDCAPTIGPLRPGRIDDSCDLVHFWSLHTGGANFAFADGSVRFLTYDWSNVLPALATRAGGEVLTDD